MRILKITTLFFVLLNAAMGAFVFTAGYLINHFINDLYVRLALMEVELLIYFKCVFWLIDSFHDWRKKEKEMHDFLK